MKGVTIIRNPSIKLDLTADDWQLYDEEDCPHRNNAAEVLNRGIEDVLNTSDNFYSQAEKIKKCQNILYSLRRYGAADSEGYAVLDGILSEFFGPEY